MFLISHSIVVMASVAFVLGLIYFYIFLENNERYMGYWGLSWLIYSLSFVLDLLQYSNLNAFIFIIGKQAFYLCGSFLFLLGSYRFFRQSLPIFWIYFTFINLFTIIGAVIFPALFLLLTLHSTIFLCFISVWNGLLFIQYPSENRMGEKYITAFIFIIWGIYKGYYPFIQPNFWLSPWSYVVGAIITNVLSILVLVIYFKKNKMEISKSEKHFRFLAENAQDVIYIYELSPAPGFKYVSPAVRHILGYLPEELYSYPEIFMNLIHPDDRNIVNSLLKNPTQYLNEPLILRMHCKEGHMIWTEQHLTLIYGSSNEITAIEGILRDISERKRVEENLIRMERARRDLLSNISHELRTPITLIQGYIECIQDGVVPESIGPSKYLDKIHTNILRLNRLINDLFQLSKLESKDIDFQLYQIPLNKLISEIFYKYETDIRNMRFNFELHLSPMISENHQIEVLVDKDRIEQVLVNLIFNAVKHTPPSGKIVVDCKVISHSIFIEHNRHDYYTNNPNNIETDPINQHNGHEAIISVIDNGSGISPQDLPHIFERFYKGHNALSSTTKSSGLGLPIAKEIVEFHGGRIWAQSKLHEGSTFSFSLPAYFRNKNNNSL